MPFRNDPEWRNGPLIFMVSSPLQWQSAAPTRVEAEEFLDGMVQRYTSSLDANDMMYAYETSRY
jgi:homoserine O-acetyltransferase